MTRLPTITSLQNPAVRQLRQLRDARKRRKTGLFLIDGAEEIQLALAAGIEINRVFASESQAELLSSEFSATPVQAVSSAVAAKIAYGQHGSQPVALAQAKSLALSEIKLSARSRILVLDRTEKPGNLGGCLRTASACEVDAVVLTNPICELWNPNCIRASRGAIFRLPIVEAEPIEFVTACEAVQLPVFLLRADRGQLLWDCDLGQGAALVFGNEADGLSGDWGGDDLRELTIPMRADTDSLNLSISCAVTLYEMARQRRNNA